MTKYPKLAGLNTRNYFLIVLEVENLRSGCQQGQFLVRTLFLACRWHLLLCPHMMERGRLCLFLFLLGH